MTLRQVEAFRAVMITGTVTEAAKMLFVSQPAISRMIADLERGIGYKLFTRANRQLIPTTEGQAFYDEVERAFIGLGQINKAAQAIREYRSGHLRLITFATAATDLLTNVIARFAEIYSDASLSLEVQPPKRVMEWILSQRCDLGLSTLPVGSGAVEVRPILRKEMVCALPPNHPLAARDYLVPADFEGQPFISYHSDSDARHLVDGVFLQDGINRDLQLEARTQESVCGLVAAGAGIALIGPVFAGLRERHLDLVIRPLRPSITVELGLIYSSHRPLPRLAARFIEVLEEFVAEEDQALPAD